MFINCESCELKVLRIHVWCVNKHVVNYFYWIYKFYVDNHVVIFYNRWIMLSMLFKFICMHECFTCKFLWLCYRTGCLAYLEPGEYAAVHYLFYRRVEYVWEVYVNWTKDHSCNGPTPLVNWQCRAISIVYWEGTMGVISLESCMIDHKS